MHGAEHDAALPRVQRAGRGRGHRDAVELPADGAAAASEVDLMATYIVTPTLAVGDVNPAFPVKVATVAEAINFVTRLEAVVVDLIEQAIEVLAHFGVDRERALWLCGVG